MKEKLLVSSCLLGKNCKYNGKNNYQPNIENLHLYYDIYEVCPEVDGGLPTPRDPSEIIGDKVMSIKGNDNTPFYNKGALHALEVCKKYNIKKALLKQKSPSCGSKIIYDGTFTSTVIKGDGVTSKLLKDNGIEVFDEDDIEQLIWNKKNN